MKTFENCVVQIKTKQKNKENKGDKQKNSGLENLDLEKMSETQLESDLNLLQKNE